MYNIDIFFVGGGTAGHVLPNIFLINELLARNSNVKIAYIGSKNSIEKKIFEQNFGSEKYFEINSDKFRRYITYKHIFVPFKILKGFFDAFLILKKYKPKLVFAKGGFVCAPVIFAAAFLKIKIFIHESDYSIGLTNKISMPFASKIGVTFEKTIQENQKFAKKMQLFGPIFNKEILNTNEEITQKNFSNILSDQEKEKLSNWKSEKNFLKSKKILLILGGSLGSKIINQIIYKDSQILLKDFNIVHICGKGNFDSEIQRKSKENIDFNYILLENISHEEMIFFIKFSDIVVSRAGINSVFELMFFRKMTIFIPLSRKTSRGDQIENAEYFFSKGACEIIYEEKLNSEILYEKLKTFLNKEIYEIYQNNLQKIEIRLGTDEIVDKIESFLKI